MDEHERAQMWALFMAGALAGHHGCEADPSSIPQGVAQRAAAIADLAIYQYRTRFDPTFIDGEGL